MSKEYKIEEETLNEVLGYLSLRPFGEVAQLVDKLMKSVLIQEAPPVLSTQEKPKKS